MIDQTPAAVLRAAAANLRHAAQSAIHEGRSTWVLGATKGSKSPVVVDDPDRPSVLIETWAERLESVNAYLTFVPPAVGLALATLLESEASLMELAVQDGLSYPESGPILDLAHALGSAAAVKGTDR